jgi:hypothetical protein
VRRKRILLPGDAVARRAWEGLRSDIWKAFAPTAQQNAALGILIRLKLREFLDAPEPPETLKAIQIRDELGAELQNSGIPVSETRQWLAKGRELQRLQPLAKALKEKAAPSPLRERAQRSSETVRAEKRVFSRSDERSLRQYAVELARSIDRAGKRAFQLALWGEGRAKDLGLHAAVEGLNKLMIQHCGRGRNGLVAALLLDAGIIKTGCWTPAPTVSTEAQKRVWCTAYRHNEREKMCWRGPLRCERATRRVAQLLKDRRH